MYLGAKRRYINTLPFLSTDRQTDMLIATLRTPPRAKYQLVASYISPEA